MIKPHTTEFSDHQIIDLHDRLMGTGCYVIMSGSSERGDAADESYASAFIQALISMGYSPSLYDNGMVEENGVDAMAERLSVNLRLMHYIRPKSSDLDSMSPWEQNRETVHQSGDLIDAVFPGNSVVLIFPGKEDYIESERLIRFGEDKGIKAFIFIKNHNNPEIVNVLPNKESYFTRE